MTWFLNMTAYTTITALLILFIKFAFRNKMSAKWQYYIWGMLLVRIILPVLPQSDISLFNKVPKVNNIKVAYEGYSPYAKTLSSRYYFEGNVGLKDARVVIPIEKAPVDYMIYIWAALAIFLFVYFLFVYISFSKQVRSMKLCDDSGIIELFEACKKKVGVKAAIKVVIGGEVPIQKGLFRPVIVIQKGYSKEELRDIFIHELCHYKYYDVVAIWIGAIILCVNWFNPVIWYSFFVVRKDIELLCDYRVLQITGNKKEYASLLLKTALRKNKFMLGTTSIQNGEKEVTKRIKYIANFKKPKIYWSAIIVLAAILVGGSCLTNASINDGEQIAKAKSRVEALLGERTPYVGNHVKVLNILGQLPIPKGLTRNGIELLTMEQPYGIIVNLNVTDRSKLWKGNQLYTQQFYRNSAILFSLIDNVDNVFIRIKNENQTYQLIYRRGMIETYFKKDVRKLSKTKGVFKAFLKRVDGISFDNKILVYNDPNAFNIYNADSQVNYLFKAKSYYVNKESRTKELPAIIKSEYGVDVKKINIIGTTMVLNLDKSMLIDLDKGSTYAVYTLSSLYKSLLELKGIKTVKVLVDGKEGVDGNHYSFKTPVTFQSDGRTELERYFKISRQPMN